ncbi:LysR family transcriptional regulator [Photobacterium sp. ZSDE20]|uniref:LysR family transcriptional regulator n=1 Tax=Photobacterium pectinilyticum TaxID=2906793 RepID=A0ABT1N2L5_9GAMM|nr:LysR family transcriptional regulator [Photobacterium sp. ZSDE20]MCQ1058995.1 LysR family transcriptional regulator [Photobacterium sp. ZSDE20]
MKTEDIKLFHKVVEFGSLTETAKWLDLPKSNISRRIKQLETDLNTKLFHRHSRHITLTAAGNKFYRSSLPIMEQLDSTISQLQSPDRELSGKLKIMISPIMMNIGKMVFDFMKLHPNVEVEIISSPYEQDLVKNDIDVAFRLAAEVTEENLVGREIGREVYGLFASPHYLSKHGEPKTLDMLSHHPLITYRFSNGQVYNKLPLDNGQYIQLKSGLNSCS